MAKKARTHRVIMTITFDKPCSRPHAVREANECINGTFYPFQPDDSFPGALRVRSIKSLPERATTEGREG